MRAPPQQPSPFNPLIKTLLGGLACIIAMSLSTPVEACSTTSELSLRWPQDPMRVPTNTNIWLRGGGNGNQPIQLIGPDGPVPHTVTVYPDVRRENSSFRVIDPLEDLDPNTNYQITTLQDGSQTTLEIHTTQAESPLALPTLNNMRYYAAQHEEINRDDCEPRPNKHDMSMALTFTLSKDHPLFYTLMLVDPDNRSIVQPHQIFHSDHHYYSDSRSEKEYLEVYSLGLDGLVHKLVT